MKYNPPYGSSNPDAPYINATPGQKGSPVPAEAIEYTQREIVNAITQAGLTPRNEDLNQLYQAMQKMVQGGAYALPPATASALGGIMVDKGGLTITAAGIVSLLLDPQGGLALDSQGRAYVNPDAFSTKIINEMMKQLRLPQYLTAATSFYVSPSGNNQTGDGSQSNPWRTIQYACNIIATNYNLGIYNAFIICAPGVYSENLIFPPYAGLGTIHIVGTEPLGNVRLNGNIVASQNAGGWIMQMFEIQWDGTTPPLSSGWFMGTINSGGRVGFQGCRFNFTFDTSYTGRSGINAFGGQANYSRFQKSDGAYQYCEFLGNTNTYISSGNNGISNVYMDINFQGTVVDATARAINQSSIIIHSFTDEAGVFRRAVCSGAVTGRRYRAANLSSINTSGGGANYFPGTVDGTLASGAVYA